MRQSALQRTYPKKKAGDSYIGWKIHRKIKNLHFPAFFFCTWWYSSISTHSACFYIWKYVFLQIQTFCKEWIEKEGLAFCSNCFQTHFQEKNHFWSKKIRFSWRFPAFFFFLEAFFTHRKFWEAKRRLGLPDALCFMRFGQVEPKRRPFAQKNTLFQPLKATWAPSQISHLYILF